MIFNYLTIEWTTGSNSLGDPQTGLGGSPAQVTKKIVQCRKIKMLKVHICCFFLKGLNQDNQIDMKIFFITSPIIHKKTLTIFQNRTNKKNFNFVNKICSQENAVK